MRQLEDGNDRYFQADVANITRNFPRSTVVQGDDGCEVTSDGDSMELDVAGGTVAILDEAEDVDSGTVQIGSANSYDRYDLVVVDENHDLDVIEGDEEKKTPELPVDNCLLAIVRVEADTDTIATGDVLDARILSELTDFSELVVEDLIVEGGNTKADWHDASSSGNVAVGNAAVLWAGYVPDGDQLAVYEAGLTRPDMEPVEDGLSLRVIRRDGEDDIYEPSGNVLIEGNGTTDYSSELVEDGFGSGDGGAQMAVVVDNGEYGDDIGETAEVVAHAKLAILDNDTEITVGDN